MKSILRLLYNFYLKWTSQVNIYQKICKIIVWIDQICIENPFWSLSNSLIMFEFEYLTQTEEYQYGCMDLYIRKTSEPKALKGFVLIHFPSKKISSVYCYLEKLKACDPFEKFF